MEEKIKDLQDRLDVAEAEKLETFLQLSQVSALTIFHFSFAHYASVRKLCKVHTWKQHKIMLTDT